MVLNTQQTEMAISDAREAAFHQFDDATQVLWTRYLQPTNNPLVMLLSLLRRPFSRTNVHVPACMSGGRL